MFVTGKSDGLLLMVVKAYFNMSAVTEDKSNINITHTKKKATNRIT